MAVVGEIVAGPGVTCESLGSGDGGEVVGSGLTDELSLELSEDTVLLLLGELVGTAVPTPTLFTSSTS